jgi:hypothetical protein
VAVEDLVGLGHRDGGEVEVGSWPGEQPASRGFGGWIKNPRGDPAEVFAGQDSWAGHGRGERGPVELGENVLRDGAPVQSRDIGGVDRVGEVADGEHAGDAGGLSCVDERAARVGVDLEAAGAGQFAVRDPVAGQDDGVAVDRASRMGVKVLDLDGADAAVADDAGESGASGDRDS